tara:strand:+ start:458 stop:715 length:258 start_codon:yes stop_codon:yes gene_type:complete
MNKFDGSREYAARILAEGKKHWEEIEARLSDILGADDTPGGLRFLLDDYFQAVGNGELTGMERVERLQTLRRIVKDSGVIWNANF